MRQLLIKPVFLFTFWARAYDYNFPMTSLFSMALALHPGLVNEE